MYDQEAATTRPGHEGKTDVVRHANGQHNPVYLRINHGVRLYAGVVGQGSGQHRNFQDDFTRVFYSYRRHDWVPVWYQTHAK